MIADLLGRPEVDDFEKLAILLLGPDSKVYQVFKDAIGIPHIRLSQFMETFFFICRMNQNLTELWKDDDISIRTDPYMH